MSLSSAKKILKSPWIPPGRARREDILKCGNKLLKPSKVKGFQSRDEDAYVVINEECGCTKIKIGKEFLRCNIGSLQQEAESSLELAPTESSTEPKIVRNEFPDTESSCSEPVCVDFSNEMQAHIRSIKDQMRLFQDHFVSLKKLSYSLNEYIDVFTVEDPTIRDMLSKIVDEVNKFISGYDDLEYAVALTENAITHEKKVEEYMKALKLKENLLCMLLDCYSKVLSASHSLLKIHDPQRLSKRENEQLHQQLQENEKCYLSQSVVIKNLEKKTSILQGKLNTMESYKGTLESVQAELQKQLSFKESQIQCLQSRLRDQPILKPDGSERLLEVIEEMKDKATAEKGAFKKALKSQKLTLEKIKLINEKLQKVIDVKNSNLAEIADQRDQLKLQLTVANNNLIESRSEIADLKNRNLKLQSQLCDGEVNFDKQHQQLLNSLEEKTAELNDALQSKLNCEKHIMELRKKLELSRRELKQLQLKASTKNDFPSGGEGDHKPASDENIKDLISLLKDSQSHCHEQNQNQISVHLLKAVEEVKEQLLDLKTLQSTRSTSSIKSGKPIQEAPNVQSMCPPCSQQTEALMAELKELKKHRIQNPLEGGGGDSICYSLMMPDNGNYIQNLQAELRSKTEENRRLKEKEKDLERQLDEVKEKLQKKEIEHVRFFAVEEELRTKKNELSRLEKEMDEESHKLLNRSKELEEQLDKTKAENESLKNYIQVLKTSYWNVFGTS